jgi:hypothetical protein
LIKTAETGPTIEKADDPPKHELVPFPLAEIPKDKAIVCFYRERRTMGFGVNFEIFIKGRGKVMLSNGSFVCFATTPGAHFYRVLGIRNHRFKWETKRIVLMPGVATYLSAHVVDRTLTLIPEAEALEAIRELKSAY